MSKIVQLKQFIMTGFSFIPHSRAHTLKTFNTPSAQCFTKRDDELSFSISGSKLRKYTSLLRFLLIHNYQEAIVIGGAYSNNVLGLSQLLIENKLKPSLFLLDNPSTKLQGNLLLTSLLVPSSQIHWIARADWPQVERLATNYAKENGQQAYVIPEGAFMPEALPGALTLPVDILHNETDLQHEFQHVFIDAGTGLTAMAVILAFAWLKKKTQVHVLLLADNEAVFINKLKQLKAVFEKLISDALSWEAIAEQFKLHLPTQARSFGATNTEIFTFIKTLARTEGFLTDPIYSAKLFFEAKKIITSTGITDNVLIVHSGGALSLTGFQKELLKTIS